MIVLSSGEAAILYCKAIADRPNIADISKFLLTDNVNQCASVVGNLSRAVYAVIIKRHRNSTRTDNVGDA